MQNWPETEEEDLKGPEKVEEQRLRKDDFILITVITHLSPSLNLSDPLLEMKNLISSSQYHIAEEHFYQVRQFQAHIRLHFFLFKVVRG